MTRPYGGVDTLRDLETVHDDGTRPWRAEFPALATRAEAMAIADRVAAEGGCAHVWSHGDLVYRAYPEGFDPKTGLIVRDDD